MAIFFWTKIGYLGGFVKLRNMVKSAAKRTDTSSKLRPASIQTEIKSPGDFINAISNKVSNSDSTPFLCVLLSTQNSHCLFWRSIPTGRIRHKRKHNIPKRAIPHLNYHLHQQIAKFCPIFSIFIFRSACCLVLLAKSGRIDNTSGFIYSNMRTFSRAAGFHHPSHRQAANSPVEYLLWHRAQTLLKQAHTFGTCRTKLEKKKHHCSFKQNESVNLI